MGIVFKPPLRSVLDLRDRLRRDPVISRLVGEVIEKEAYHDLLNRIVVILPNSPPHTAVDMSIRHLLGSEFSQDSFLVETWRLAAASPSLAEGAVSKPWRRQLEEEPVIVQVTGVKRVRRYGRHYGQLSLRIMNGTPAGLAIEKSWSSRMLSAVAYSVGFGKPWDDDRYESPPQYFGLRLPVVLDPELSRQRGRPDFSRLLIEEGQKRISPAYLLKHNRQLLKCRQRPPGVFTCPQGKPELLSCHRCEFGLDNCPVATHHRTYVLKECSGCHTSSWFEPDRQTQLCVTCWERQELH